MPKGDGDTGEDWRFLPSHLPQTFSNRVQKSSTRRLCILFFLPNSNIVDNIHFKVSHILMNIIALLRRSVSRDFFLYRITAPQPMRGELTQQTANQSPALKQTFDLVEISSVT